MTESAASPAQGERTFEQKAWADGHQSEPFVLGDADEGRLIACAAALVAERKRWAKTFGEHGRLFGDPFWSILLDLYIQPHQQPISVSSACLATGCPSTTALRHLSVLVDRGLVARERNLGDRRVMLVRLTAVARELITRCLSEGVR